MYFESSHLLSHIISSQKQPPYLFFSNRHNPDRDRGLFSNINIMPQIYPPVKQLVNCQLVSTSIALLTFSYVSLLWHYACAGPYRYAANHTAHTRFFASQPLALQQLWMQCPLLPCCFLCPAFLQPPLAQHHLLLLHLHPPQLSQLCQQQ